MKDIGKYVSTLRKNYLHFKLKIFEKIERIGVH